MARAATSSAASAFALLLGACSALELPVYDPGSTTISRQARVHTAGTLERHGGCLLIRTFGQVEGVAAAPIWPQGTRMGGDRVLLPSGAPVPIGRRIGLMGRFVEPNERGLAAQSRGCPGRPLLIEEAHLLYAWNSAAELADLSDAVLVVEVTGINPRDPRADGLLTTIDGTVIEPIKRDDYRPGERVRFRLPAGQDAQGRWHTSAHDRLYGPFGGQKPQLVGERLLLFVSDEFYSEQARVRGGRALRGFTGGTFYRLQNDQIVNDGDSPMAANLTELREQLRLR